MEKDFDKWNEIKKKIDAKELRLYCKPRDIWWCSIGLNIGSEEDGKNELFERPTLVLKVFNKNMVRIVPLTSKIVDDLNHSIIFYQGNPNSALLSQIKTISTKRLTRKIGMLDSVQFGQVVEAILSGFI